MTRGFDAARVSSRRYWHDRVAARPAERARLRPDFPHIRSASFDEIQVAVPADVHDLLERISGGVPLLRYALLTSGLWLLLYRLTGRPALAVAGPSLREPGEAPNTLLHIIEWDRRRSFRALLDAARAGLLDDHRHRGYPFPVLLADRGLPQGAHDLFDLLIADHDLHQAPEPSGQDLTWTLEGSAQAARLTCEVAAGRYRSGSVRRLIELYWNALRAGAARPDAPIAELDLLSARDRERVLIEWNRTEAPCPEVPVDELFRRQAARTTGAVAVADPVAGVELSYAELAGRVDALARQLRTLGVRPETAVGVHLDRSPRLIVALLAVLTSGGAFVPLDPESPPHRLARILADARADLVLTDRDRRASLDPAAARILDLDELAGIVPSTAPPYARHADQLAYVLYTSGSTGDPKGVMVSHRSLANYLLWAVERYRLVEGGDVPVVSSHAFDLALTSLVGPLLAGRAVVLTRDMRGFDPLAGILGVQARFGLIKMTPSQLEGASLSLTPGQIGTAARCLVLGGEALREPQLAPWRAAAPETAIFNEYGPTETTVGSCVFDARSPGASDTVPIGTPIANTQIFLLDADLQPVPDNVSGIIYIGGLGLARGYRDRPSATAEAFIPSPFAGRLGERLYRTGDLARRLPDGNLEFLGRATRQVKVRGYRVEPGEIEAALRTLPGIQAAAAVAREETAGHPRLVAYLVAGGTSPTFAAIRRHLATLLPEYMLPSAFVCVDALPLAASGKVDYARLPAPDASAGGAPAPTEAAAPRNDTERTLAAIWQDVLGVRAVGVHDDFFDLGGDSILGIRVAVRARQAGLSFQPSQLFEATTIAELARLVIASPVETAVDRASGPVPLTPVQHWFFEWHGEAPDGFCQTRYLELTRPTTPEALEQALARLVDAHDALRLRFRRRDGRWEQTLADDVHPLVVSLDAASLPVARQEQEIEAARRRGVDRLNLAHGPLLQAALITMAPGRQRLFLAVHHLAVDHVSWLTLLEDLEGALDHPTLPRGGTSFARWARRLDARARAGELDEAGAFWASMPAAPDAWSADRDGATSPDLQTPADGILVELSSDETARLVGEANRAHNTQTRDLLLTALCLAFARVTGRTTLRVALEANGRADRESPVDVARTVGWFTALSPVDLTLPALDEPARSVEAVKAQLRRIPDDGVAYGVLRYLCPDRPAGDAIRRLAEPLVSFNYLGRVDHEILREGRFRALPGNQGYVRPALARRPHRVEVNALVAAGSLRIEFTWDDQREDRTVVETVATRFVAELRALLDHCATCEPGCAPSDFRFVDLDAATLAAVLDEVQAEEGRPV